MIITIVVEPNLAKIFNISQDNAGGWLNEEITMGIQKELLSTMAEPCKSAAEVRCQKKILILYIDMKYY